MFYIGYVMYNWDDVDQQGEVFSQGVNGLMNSKLRNLFVQY